MEKENLVEKNNIEMEKEEVNKEELENKEEIYGEFEIIENKVMEEESIQNMISKKKLFIFGCVCLAVFCLIFIGVFECINQFKNKGNDEATLFHEGLLAVGQINENAGITDADGNYTGMKLYDDSYIWGYINKNGECVITPQFDEASQFSEGLAAIRKGSKGYINKKGEYVITPQYVVAHDFDNGIARVCETYDVVFDPDKWDEGYYYVDKKGNKVSKEKVEKIAEKIDSKVDDKLPTKTKIDKEGLMLKRENGKYGYVNKKGKYVIAPQFYEAGEFCEGLACVNIGGEWGYINKKGKIVIKPQYTYATDFFADGYAIVCIYNETLRKEDNFIINKKGERLETDIKIDTFMIDEVEYHG